MRIGRSVRMLRQRRGWRQKDVAARAGVSQSAVSRIERGALDHATLRTLDRVLAALGARLDARVSWQGAALDRLLDEGHATLVEEMNVRLARYGWQTLPETTFAIGGERGGVDVLGWHPRSGMVLAVEVKTALGDLQLTLASIDRKRRLAPRIAREQGWAPAGVATLLVLGEDRTLRRQVQRFAATLGRAFPVRGPDVTRWLREPGGAGHLRAAVRDTQSKYDS